MHQGIIFPKTPSRASYGGAFCEDLGENWPHYNGTALRYAAQKTRCCIWTYTEAWLNSSIFIFNCGPKSDLSQRAHHPASIESKGTPIVGVSIDPSKCHIDIGRCGHS